MLFCVYGHRFARKNEDPLELDEWKSTFSTQHAFDAHAWPYVLTKPNGELVAPFRVESKGGTPNFPGLVNCSLLFLDYDAETKQVDHADLLVKVLAIPPELPMGRWALIYPTLGGLRVVYRLSRPVLADKWGAAVRGVAFEFWRATGLKVDPSTDQWWRCFRLPMVTRADEKAQGPTWEQDYFFPAVWGKGDPSLDPSSVAARAEKLPWDPHYKGNALTTGSRKALAGNCI